jgi:hypothetical protein
MYQPLMNQSEDSHICPACKFEKTTTASRPTKVHFLAVALGFIGLFLGGYAALGLGFYRHDSKLHDQFIPSRYRSHILPSEPTC